MNVYKLLKVISGSFSGLLTILFVILKLTNVIAWSWWWVLSPLWIPTAIVIVFLIAVMLVATAVYLDDEDLHY